MASGGFPGPAVARFLGVVDVRVVVSALSVGMPSRCNAMPGKAARATLRREAGSVFPNMAPEGQQGVCRWLQVTTRWTKRSNPQEDAVADRAWRTGALGGAFRVVRNVRCVRDVPGQTAVTLRGASRSDTGAPFAHCVRDTWSCRMQSATTQTASDTMNTGRRRGRVGVTACLVALAPSCFDEVHPTVRESDSGAADASADGQRGAAADTSEAGPEETGDAKRGAHADGSSAGGPDAPGMGGAGGGEDARAASMGNGATEAGSPEGAADLDGASPEGSPDAGNAGNPGTGDGGSVRDAGARDTSATPAACLSGLQASAGTLQPVFDSATSTYTVTVPFAVTEISLTASVCDPGAEVNQDPANPVALDVGSTPVTFTVTATDGISKTAYGVTVVRLEDEQWVGLGDPTYFSHFVLDPVDPARIYAGYANGIYKSVDRGEHWTEVRLFTADIVRDLEVDPLDNDVVFAGVTAVGTGGTGVYRSANRGNTWTQVVGDASVSTLAIDPLDSTVVYAGTVGGTYAGDAQGVLKSQDSGSNWAPANLGLASLEIVDIQVRPDAPETLYASTEGGLHRSDNGGDTWYLYENGLPSGSLVLSLAIDPRNPSTVYAATLGDGVFKSDDGGGTWSASNTGITVLTAEHVVINPADTAFVYAATSEGVFRSMDRGVSWALIPSDGVFWRGDVGVLGFSAAEPAVLHALFSSGSTGARIYRRREPIQ